MRRVVVDASALAVVTFGEPGGDSVAKALEGAEVCAPTLLRYEMQSVAAKKCRLSPRQSGAIVAALERALDARSHIVWFDPRPADVVLLAQATGLTPYDANYLWLAGFLGADLVTLDRALAAACDGTD